MQQVHKIYSNSFKWKLWMIVKHRPNLECSPLSLFKSRPSTQVNSDDFKHDRTRGRQHNWLGEKWINVAFQVSSRMQRAALAGPWLASFPNEAFAHWQLISRGSTSSTTKPNFHTLKQAFYQLSLQNTEPHYFVYRNDSCWILFGETKENSPLQCFGLIFKAPKKLTCKPLFVHTTNNHMRLDFYIWYFDILKWQFILFWVSCNIICSPPITLWTRDVQLINFKCTHLTTYLPRPPKN